MSRPSQGWVRRVRYSLRRRLLGGIYTERVFDSLSEAGEAWRAVLTEGDGGACLVRIVEHQGPTFGDPPPPDATLIRIDSDRRP